MASVVIDISQAQISHLVKSLKRLRDPKLAKRIVQSATRRAMKSVLLPPAFAKTPVKTGAMRAALKVRPIKKSKTNSTWGSRLGYSARDFVGDEFYAGFVELGWRVGKRSAEVKRFQRGLIKAGVSQVERSEILQASTADTRRKIPGKRILIGVAEADGKQAATMAALLIQRALVKEAKKQGKIPKARIRLGTGRIPRGVSRRINIRT